MISQAPFHRSPRGIVLDAVAREDSEVAIIALDGHRDVMFAFGREQKLLDPRAEIHCLRGLTNVMIGLFEGAHELDGEQPLEIEPQAGKRN